MNAHTPKTISEAADEMERIQQELLRLQRALERMERASTTSRGYERKKATRQNPEANDPIK